MGKCKCGCGRRVAYSGTYCAGHVPAGTSRDPHGKIKASSAKSNPISNAKVQQRKLDEAVARINEMSKVEDALTLEEATECAADIMGHVGDGFNTHGADVEEFLGIDGSERNRDGWSHSVYVGYTACAIADEALRWLTPRGLSRPVLLWSDGTTITMGKAQSELGFIFQEVYASKLKCNARMVENALQQRYQHLDLGHRLWRCADMGSKYDKEVDLGKVHKVFITYSPLISEMLADGKIMVNK
jgi:hypothetical protein